MGWHFPPLGYGMLKRDEYRVKILGSYWSNGEQRKQTVTSALFTEMLLLQTLNCKESFHLMHACDHEPCDDFICLRCRLSIQRCCRTRRPIRTSSPVILSSATNQEISVGASCSDDSCKIVHSTSHDREKVNCWIFSPLRNANCILTGLIALERPMHFISAGSESCGDVILSLLLPSQRPVPATIAVPSKIIIFHVGDVLGVCSFFVAKRPDLVSNFGGVYFHL